MAYDSNFAECMPRIFMPIAECRVLCRLLSFMPSKMPIAKYFTRHLLKRENNTKTQQTTHTHTHTHTHTQVVLEVVHSC